MYTKILKKKEIVSLNLKYIFQNKLCLYTT